jgi:hypothetical protein
MWCAAFRQVDCSNFEGGKRKKKKKRKKTLQKLYQALDE